MSAEKTEARKIITDKLVLEKTGRKMEEWFLLLDKRGAQKMTHPEIYALVSSIKGLESLGEWNRNLLTTSYEWDRKLKERGQKEKGFEISVSKTIAVPIHVLYASLTDAPARSKWLKEKITIRKSTENKSARITWADGTTSLSVDFYSKGPDKSQVVVQHHKIPNSKQAADLKTFWTQKLNALKTLLEN